MNRRGPTHIDTTAFFVRDRLRGKTMPDSRSMNLDERLNSWHPMHIRLRNARLLDPEPTLASHGFELVRIESAINSSQSVNERRDTYCAESRRIIEKLTGCVKSRMLNQVYRGGFQGLGPGEMLDPSLPSAGTVTHYSELAHTDVSPYLERQLEWTLFVKKRHGAIYNVWRSTDLDDPVQSMPLAVCHNRSIASRDMVAGWYDGLLPDGGPFLGYNLAYDAFQQWYYYPGMTREEALVIKVYDTREELGNRRGVFHMAVADPGEPPGAKRRQSVDIRVGALFENETGQEVRRARYHAELPPFTHVVESTKRH